MTQHTDEPDAEFCELQDAHDALAEEVEALADTIDAIAHQAQRVIDSAIFPSIDFQTELTKLLDLAKAER